MVIICTPRAYTLFAVVTGCFGGFPIFARLSKRRGISCCLNQQDVGLRDKPLKSSHFDHKLVLRLTALKWISSILHLTRQKTVEKLQKQDLAHAYSIELQRRKRSDLIETMKVQLLLALVDSIA